MSHQQPPMTIDPYPLVSCIMPTYGRPRLVHESVAMFLAQDYPNKELILLNDCPGQEYLSRHLGVSVINHPVRYPSLGEKRNAAIELAQGEFIAVWDDDDVYLPWRLSYCVDRMMKSKSKVYLPNNYWAYWGKPDLEINHATLDWISHPLLMFRKELWQAVAGYPLITLGEDRGFYLRVLEYTQLEWFSQPIDSCDRFAIMRGVSPYVHTSIEGGRSQPELGSGRIQIEPCAIDDPILRLAAERLAALRDFQLQSRSSGKTAELKSEICPDELACDESRMSLKYLDDLEPTIVRVGYGSPGQHGKLGYEDRTVVVGGAHYPHALSLHGPSEAFFDLNGRYTNFAVTVAINDDVLGYDTAADFLVYADDRLVGVATNVRPGDPPRSIQSDITCSSTLSLIVRARRWDCCHSVWLSPCVWSIESTQTPHSIPSSELSKQRDSDSWMLDCIGQARVERTALMSAHSARDPELVIATVGSPGWEDWVDDLLGSICANAQCPDAQLIIFFYGSTEKIRQVAAKYDAKLIACEQLSRLNIASKSVLYSVAKVIAGKRFICLDADMLVTDDLRPIVTAIDSHPAGSILVCREAKPLRSVHDAMVDVYGGSMRDIVQLLSGRDAGVANYPLVVNDGFFAGSSAALRAVDDFIRTVTDAKSWIEHGVPWRNQCVFNLALARLDCGIEMDSRFNVQLNHNLLDLSNIHQPRAGGRRAAVVHFCGGGRQKYPEMRGRYRVTRPLTKRTATPDAFRQFVNALRTWIGQRGEQAMTWSFYGTSDGIDARVTDSSNFCLLATLHYMIRSNGCARVIETGTARGVTAACIASAIVHRTSPCIVSLDPNRDPQRDELWSILPPEISACIQPRTIDGLAGMAQCLANGQSFHAALLDSIHSREHVLKEFELARQLVCEGGLILIHDPVLCTGTVQQALDEITSMGYPVVKLWTSLEGSQEDDRLGLAVIENRLLRS